MPRAPVAGREIRRRSRNGCWNCKARKVKCGEEKPRCSNCTRLGEDCDYKIRLSWGGRPLKKKLLEQGAQLDDASQNIPGAGQFSLNTSYQPQFPSAAQFEQAAHSSTRTSPTLSSCTTKSSSSRKSTSSQAGLATYQNVFSRSSITSSPPPGSELSYNGGLATTVPALSIPVPTTSGQLNYYGNPVTPPSLSNQETIRGNPYVSHDRVQRRSVDNFQVSQEYSFADRFVSAGDSYASQQMGQNTTPYIGIVDADADAVEDLHSAAIDSKGHMGSDAFATIKGHPGYLQLPKELNPLPQTLAENHQSTMYFQHFLQETAPLLVPHDCSGNPFKSVLPQMAMKHDGLLNLLLAYSASHQARQANQTEPTELVSGFLDRAYRHLHQSLNDEHEQKSNATLATAIMLCSYEIISPNSFAEGITWQIHLNAARRIIIARGGAQEMHSRDPVSFFLSRWFAYLDVLGSFSNNNNNVKPLFPGKYWTVDEEDVDGLADFSVDCFFGFTSRFIGLLTRILELVRQSDEERSQFTQGVRNLGYAADGSEWVPEGQIYNDALRVREQLEESRRHAIGTCKHNQATTASSSSGVGAFDQQLVEDDNHKEMLASNDAYHWAAQIHLFRRVLNYDKHHQYVKDAVQRIIEAMHHIPEQSNAENAALFPLFTAGCESTDEGDRNYILRRLQVIEQSGMTQCQRARALMQRVWETGSSWGALINGEFIG